MCAWSFFPGRVCVVVFPGSCVRGRFSLEKKKMNSFFNEEGTPNHSKYPPTKSCRPSQSINPRRFARSATTQVRRMRSILRIT